MAGCNVEQFPDCCGIGIVNHFYYDYYNKPEECREDLLEFQEFMKTRPKSQRISASRANDLHGWDFIPTRVLKILQKFEDYRNQSISERMDYEAGEVGLFILAVTETQKDIFKDVFTGLGYREVSKSINPKTMNTIYTWVKELNPDDVEDQDEDIDLDGDF